MATTRMRRAGAKPDIPVDADGDRIYTEEGMATAHFDYPDGGFRGWGTLIPVTMGTRTRYFWLTFDRHNASAFRWSYGNLYCFEA